MMMNSKENVDKIFEILTQSQHSEYIGEDISQLDHSLQCAYFAQKRGASEEVVIACLLHDIGHLCAPEDTPQMDELGVLKHEEIGANFLLSLGYGQTIAKLVAGHVQGKRYLCAKNKKYYERLSQASKGTLEFQGGPMSQEEVKEFEEDTLFKSHLLVRQCDEMSKQVDFSVPGLESYRNLLEKYCLP